MKKICLLISLILLLSCSFNSEICNSSKEFIFYFQDSPFKDNLILQNDIYDFLKNNNIENKKGYILANVKFEYFKDNILTKKYQEKISFLADKNFPDKEMTIKKFERIPRELRKNFLKEFISSDCSFHRSKFIEENKKELYKEFVKIDVTGDKNRKK